MDFSVSVKNKLLEIINQMEEKKECFVKNPGRDFSRERKLGFSKTLPLMLGMGAQSLKKEIPCMSGFNTGTPSASAFCQQRAKIKLSAFYHIMYSLDNAFPKKTYRGHQLVACGGTDICLPLGQQEGRGYVCRRRENQKDYYQMHVNALYDIINHRYMDIVGQPEKKQNEREAFLEMLEHRDYSPGTIFVMDRGYEGYGIAGALHFKGMFYVIRAKDGRTGGIVKSFGLPCSGGYDRTFCPFFTFRHNSMVLSHPETYHRIHRSSSVTFIDRNHPYRRMPVRILRIKVHPGKYECIITNLPADKFPPEETRKIYKMRWDIETSFRELKYEVGMSYFHSKKEEYTAQEIITKVILYNFCCIIASGVTVTQKKRKYKYKTSYVMVFFLCRKFLVMPDSAPGIDIEALLNKELLPVRPGRSCKRKLKAHPAVSFLYRTFWYL